MDSEDSDFYGTGLLLDAHSELPLQKMEAGTDEVKQRLRERVDQVDVQELLELYKDDVLQLQSRNDVVVKEPERLHNPYHGIPYARQLTETVDEFLARLCPSRTIQNEETPWIFVCNPYISRLQKDCSDGTIKGNEDEAPGEEGNQLQLVMHGSMERLNLIKSLENKLLEAGEPKSVMECEMNLERQRAASDILTLAHVAKVRTGKWLLFCETKDVDYMWEVVVRATINNELGIAAKVAPKSLEYGYRRQQLLCVYTADFNDKTDVGRVLKRLRKLRLFKPKETIYYKPDVYTYIGIARDNPWGMKASIYNSRDTF